MRCSSVAESKPVRTVGAGISSGISSIGSLFARKGQEQGDGEAAGAAAPRRSLSDRLSSVGGSVKRAVSRSSAGGGNDEGAASPPPAGDGK